MNAPTADPTVAATGAFVDHTFRSMGCDVRIYVTAEPGADGAGPLEASAARAEALVHACAARLTRFDDASELSRLNQAAETVVAVSPLLAHAVAVAIHAAERSAGLLDPTLTAQLARAGYASDWDPARRAPLTELLAAAPPRHAAAPSPQATWQAVTVDRAGGAVSRPAGVTLDLGATAKGLIADLALRALGPSPLAFVDAGGDLAITADQLTLLAEDPFDGAPVAFDVFGACGVATSSIAGRCWLGDDGRPAHHLLNPATGDPAFTGVVQATACAPSAAEAERLAGQALLAGPQHAPAVLAEFGGLYLLDDGSTHRIPAGGLR